MSNIERGVRTAFPQAALPLESCGLIWKKTLPDGFIGVTGFAFGTFLLHILQCHQRTILTGIRSAYCASDVCQPWRHRFVFDNFRCCLLRPINRGDVDETDPIEHIPYSADKISSRFPSELNCAIPVEPPKIAGSTGSFSRVPLRFPLDRTAISPQDVSQSPQVQRLCA